MDGLKLKGLLKGHSLGRHKDRKSKGTLANLVRSEEPRERARKLGGVLNPFCRDDEPMDSIIFSIK